MPVQKDGSIIINEWVDGIAKSSYLGFEEIRNCNVKSRPGIITVNGKMAKDSSTTIDNGPLWMRLDGLTTYMVDDTGQPYKRTSGGTWSKVTGNTDGNGNGLAIWKDHLFKMENTKIDSYGLLSGTPAWESDFQTDLVDVGSVGLYDTLVGQDDILYIGGGNQVASLQEVSGQTFVDATSATYTWNANALDLPANYVIEKMAELGDKLMISANNRSTNQSDIFPWDRESDTFDLPIRLAQNDIHSIITANNLIYIFAGREVSIYVTDGTDLQKIGTLPDTMRTGTDRPPASILFYPDAVEYFNNKIYFATSDNGGANTYTAGVWSIDEDKKIVLEHTISTGNSGQNDKLLTIPSIVAKDDYTLVTAWEDTDASEIGSDSVASTSRFCTGYTAYAITQFYKVGTKLNPKTFKQIDIQLTKPLVTDEGIRLSYRTAQNGTFTVISTDTAAQQSFVNEQFGVTAEIIQFKIELTTPSGSTSAPELLEIIVT